MLLPNKRDFSDASDDVIQNEAINVLPCVVGENVIHAASTEAVFDSG